MAESNEENNDEKSYFQNSKKNQSELDDSDNDIDDSNPEPDIGLGSRNQRSVGRKTVNIPSVSGTSSADNLPRREENPFSFKHFLNRDCNSSLSTGGARPKVFSTSSTSGTSAKPPSPSTNNSCPSPGPRLISNPELTSGLPDFVQDHLVIEQCYLPNSSQGPAHLAVDLDKLPDFAPVPSNDQWIAYREPTDIPFDLTSSQRERSNCNPPAVLPLDLPESFPFDLPAASGEVGASKSLPDFLSDGPIHSERRNDNSQPSSEVNSPSAPPNDNRHSPRIPGRPLNLLCREMAHSPNDHHICHRYNQALQMENERLRRELDTSRRQLIDQVRRSELLEAELASLRSREYEDTAGLEKMIEQIEDNLKRTTKRAVAAESRVSKLKQEIKTLTNELNELRGQGGMASSGCDRTNPQRLAFELRAAASSAELSLRQLLSGVDNLRMIASTLENRHRIEEDPSDFLDSDSISEPGPAL